FQAEGGIRYWSVTGVQTCALPISLRPGTLASRLSSSSARPSEKYSCSLSALRLCSGSTAIEGALAAALSPAPPSSRNGGTANERSEERRAGEERRGRRARAHEEDE